MAGYFVGLKLEKSTARIAMALLISVPYIVWASPFWMPLGYLEGGDAAMAIGFLFLLLFPYAAYGALVLAAYLFGKSNKVDMIS